MLLRIDAAAISSSHAVFKFSGLLCNNPVVRGVRQIVCSSIISVHKFISIFSIIWIIRQGEEYVLDSTMNRVVKRLEVECVVEPVPYNLFL